MTDISPTVKQGRVYILLLSEYKFYIGFTERTIEERYVEHGTPQGARWTEKYKPICVVYSQYGTKDDENKFTLAMMKYYDWKNIRGGRWCKIEREFPPLALLGFEDKYYEDIAKTILVQTLSQRLDGKTIDTPVVLKFKEKPRKAWEFSLSNICSKDQDNLIKSKDIRRMGYRYHGDYNIMNGIIALQTVSTKEQVISVIKSIGQHIVVKVSDSPTRMSYVVQYYTNKENSIIVDATQIVNGTLPKIETSDINVSSAEYKLNDREIIAAKVEQTEDTVDELIHQFAKTFNEMRSTFKARTAGLSSKYLKDVMSKISGYHESSMFIKSLVRDKIRNETSS